MAKEFETDYTTPGTAIDGWLFIGGQIWNGSDFVDFDDEDQVDYALPFTEIPMTDDLSHYVLDFPTEITTAGVYSLRTTRRASPSDDPAIDDEQHGYTVAIAWDGAREVVGNLNSGSIGLGSGGGNQIA